MKLCAHCLIFANEARCFACGGRMVPDVGHMYVSSSDDGHMYIGSSGARLSDLFSGPEPPRDPATGSFAPPSRRARV